ncbi:MAG: hypothetical protein VW935_01860, partial [Novosphingobium sp.]
MNDTVAISIYAAGSAAAERGSVIIAQTGSPARIIPERVLIVDDHSQVRDGLRSIFDEAFPASEILDADSLQ